VKEYFSQSLVQGWFTLSSDGKHIYGIKAVRVGAKCVDLSNDLFGRGIEATPVDEGGTCPGFAVDAVEIAQFSRKKINAKGAAESPGIHRTEDIFHTPPRSVDAAAKNPEKGRCFRKPWKIRLLGMIWTSVT
jgi:hypothetical protein